MSPAGRRVGAAVTQPLPTLGVVVPAHDEQELLGACLDALSRAARWVAEGAVVRTVVVLDACRDGTADVARAYGVEVLTVSVHGVGAARDAGVPRAT